MDTVGSLLDKLAIIERKKEKLEEDKKKYFEEFNLLKIELEEGYFEQLEADSKGERTRFDMSFSDYVRLELKKRNNITDFEIDDQIDQLTKQIGWILIDIAKTILDGYEGKRPITFKKFKFYDSDIIKNKDNDLLSEINFLRTHNRNLWALEDERRDKSLDDTQRLRAADEVAKENKKRNDTIDRIDELVKESIESIK